MKKYKLCIQFFSICSIWTKYNQS